MTISVSLTVNGKAVTAHVDPRTLLAQLLRENLHLTGTHIGCDTGQCGACTVHLDGRAVKACNIFVAQAQGTSVTTIEGISGAKGDLHPMQAAFREHHGLQCGFCTPGMIMNAIELVQKHPNANEETVRAELDGNLCRCTGYHNIVKAVIAGAAGMKG
jgi:aerobic carbon-monoxide dehydrogenase small subunit